MRNANDFRRLANENWDMAQKYLNLAKKAKSRNDVDLVCRAMNAYHRNMADYSRYVQRANELSPNYNGLIPNG